MPLERAIRESRFAYGADAVAREMRQPPGTLALESMPSWVVGLFRRAFLTTDRPQPREWIEPLEMLSKTLNKCALHNGHYYYRELRDCPWCEIESYARVRLFNFLTAGTGLQRGHFPLDEIWKQIDAVQAPDAPLSLRDGLQPMIEPSSDALELVRDRRKYLIFSVLFSAVTGLLITILFDFPFAFPLLLVAWLAACIIGKTGQFLTIPGFFQNILSNSDDEAIEKLQERSRTAEAAANSLQERYNKEAGQEKWTAGLDELRNLKDTYENLGRLRDFKFTQLARKDQFDEYLRRFEITHPDIAGIGDNAIVNLHRHGVETAADITAECLEKILSFKRIPY